MRKRSETIFSDSIGNSGVVRDPMKSPQRIVIELPTAADGCEMPQRRSLNVISSAKHTASSVLTAFAAEATEWMWK